MNPAKLLQAISFAADKHRNQRRKDQDASPYINHPIAVATVLASEGNVDDELVLLGAILHDTVEDTKATYAQILRLFGMSVTSLVFELTSDPVALKKMGKLEYLKSHMAGMSSYALFLKLCDRLANLQDNPSPKQLEDTSIILKHLRDRRRLSKSHLAVMAEIEKILVQ